MPHQNDDHIEPARVIGRTGPAWLTYALVFCALIALGGGLWYLLAPESMARLAGRLNDNSLKVESLTLTLDGKGVIELPPNGAVEIHPAQRFGVTRLNSSRWHNYDLRLSSPDIDITSVIDGAMSTTRDLLPGETFENAREIHISVSDQGQDVADFRLLSRYTALDFMARGDAAENPEKKVEYYQKAYQLDPESALIRDKLMLALAEMGKSSGAQTAAAYENLLAQNGPDEDLLNRLAELYKSEDQNERLAAVLERLIALREEKGSPTTDQKVRLAEAKAGIGRLQEAAAIYESLLAGADIEKKGWYLGRLVVIYRQNRDSEKEIETLKRLAEIAPSDQITGIWTEIALLYEKTEDAEGRLSAWKNLSEKLPDGQAKARVLKIIGQIFAKEEKYAEAKASYQAALKMVPEDTNALINLAQLAALEKDDKAYLIHMTKVVELDPDNIDYRRKLAGALAAAKQNTKAKNEYQELLKRRPDDYNLRLVYLDFLDQINDKKTLAQQYEELAALAPDNKVLLYNLGVIHFEQQNWNKAIEAFKKVVALDQNDKEARQYLLVAYQRKNQRTDIIREAMELYKLDPSNTDYRTLMLNTCENAKDWKSFAQVAEEITKVEPDSPYGWQQLNRAQTQLGQKEPAAESLWHAAEKTKDKQSEAWFKAATAFRDLGKKERAGQAYKKILEIDPKNQRATKALADLNLK